MREPFRLTLLSMLAAGLVLAVAYLAPAQVPVLLLKFALVTLAGVLGYWLDRHLFPNARPHQCPVALRGMAWVRRAIIVGSVCVSVAIAL